MPKSAQYLPTAKELAEDHGVLLEVCQCSGCGLVQLSNDPVPYYREVIRATGISEEMKAFRRQQFRDFVREFNLAGKKVLEVGCGRGEYLRILRDCGVDVYGLEYSPDSVRQCRRDGLEVSQGFIETEDTVVPGAPFDGFIMLNFLEHLPDPNSTLRGICNNLSAGAIGLVEAPDFEYSLQHGGFHEFIADHLSYFTQSTLSTAISINGFEPLDCRKVWHDNMISLWVRKRSPVRARSLRDNSEQLCRELQGFFLRFEDKRIASWGAGHHALALISMSGVAHRLEYIVDSAPFKQGRYAPATHIPIVAPSTLNACPVDILIIMAFSYADEIVRNIREANTADHTQVYVLRETGLEPA
ncbi:MAG: class I SAM-dependent methyltransferase [Syntrophomonadaceae bacterium]|jgi:SAM-dependent methyltransferase|nr:class I SAM-dependent methyltransferase [Syntrophomonadaceae bacterium]MDH7497045.1 class I SAM-dependent methyltransferase [Syntrophomonadaceae bacterium]